MSATDQNIADLRREHQACMAIARELDAIQEEFDKLKGSKGDGR